METQSITGETRINYGLVVGGWLILAAGLTAAFGYNFVEMWQRWFPAWHRADFGLYDQISRGESYYTHGPLVPFVSLVFFFVLVRHTRIMVSPRRIAGFLILLISLLVHLVACLARVNFASGFAFIGVLAGLTVLLWGEKALKRLWFALIFLIFMVPLPEVSISQLNFRLKMIAADWGVELANMIGIIAEQRGNQVFLEGDKSMVIANICNGLRTLISVMAFGAIYVYVCRLRGFWRIALFALSVPVAVVSNSLRIVSLIMVADIWDVETATGWYHDFSGLMILITAFLLMFGFERLVLWMHKFLGKPVAEIPLFAGNRRRPEDKDQGKRLAGAIGTANGVMALALVALGAAGSWWLNRATTTMYNENLLKDILPAQVSLEGEQWYSYVMDIDQQALLILETEEAILRRYVRGRGSGADFCIVFSKDNRKGTHPPEVCLEGGGSDIIGQDTVMVPAIEGRGSIPCRELMVQTGSQITYYLYTYKCGNRYTDSFWMQQFVIFTNGLLRRNAGGALIRVSTPVEAGPDEARARAMAFMRMGIPYLDQALP